jgi:ankyrin repeat protein
LTEVHTRMGKACLEAMIMFHREPQHQADKPAPHRYTNSPMPEFKFTTSNGPMAELSDDENCESYDRIYAPPFVQYAVRFWSEHLRASGKEASRLDSKIREYVELKRGGRRHLSIDQNENWVSSASESSSNDNSTFLHLLQCLSRRNLAENLKSMLKAINLTPVNRKQIAEELLQVGARATLETLTVLSDFAVGVGAQLWHQTQILLGIRKGDTEGLGHHLKTMPSAVLDDEIKKKLLSIAVQARNADVVRVLVQNMASLKLAETPPKLSFLRTAVSNQDADIVKVLVNSKIKRMLDLGSSLHQAVELANTAICNHLVNGGANIHAPNKNKHDQTPLHVACADGHVEIVQLLVSWRARTSARDKQQKTPLHVAAEAGRHKVVEFLLHYSMFSEDTDDDGRTPLFLACAMGVIDTARMLWSAGSNIFHRDRKNRTALHAAANHGADSVVLFLVSAGCQVNARDSSNNTALHEAAFQGYKDTVSTLIHSGASVNTKNEKKESPLHRACESTNAPEAVVQVLLNGGADPHSLTEQNESPLHYAARCNQLRVISLLLRIPGIRDDVPNKGRKTPLELTSNEDCRKVLLEHRRSRMEFSRVMASLPRQDESVKYADPFDDTDAEPIDHEINQDAMEMLDSGVETLEAEELDSTDPVAVDANTQLHVF